MMRGETVPYIKEVDLPFMKYLEVDINFVVAVIDHAVAKNLRIAITKLIILVDDKLLVGLIVVGNEFLLAEELK